MKPMKNFLASLLIIFLTSTSMFTFANPSPSLTDLIMPTKPAPSFSDRDRQLELGRRRTAVSESMLDGSVLVMMSAEPRIYSQNVDFMYRQENNFFYLTALKQKGATLVMTKKDGVVKEVVFLPRRDPQRELWDGKMYSEEDARRISGINTIVSASELPSFLDALKNGEEYVSGAFSFTTSQHRNIYMVLPNNASDTNGVREYRREQDLAKELEGRKVFNLRPTFAKLRLVKSQYEIAMLRHAVDITIEAQKRAMATVRNARWEYEVQAEVEYVFRKRNASYWGYQSIVGCGPNATTLHYVESQGMVRDGQILLMDVGAEYEQYTADVTRSFPVNGRFTKEQREIYEIVYDAQEQSAATIKPGVLFNEGRVAAAETIEAGLARLGLITGIGHFIPGTEREVPDGRGGTRTVGTPQYTLWFMHGWGHWLGMNVHDVGDYSTPMRPGMVFTNEPGIYIRLDALDYMDRSNPKVAAFIGMILPAYEKYRGIGVRIEDVLMVTETGVEWLTGNLPRSVNEIETFMDRAKSRDAVANVLAIRGMSRSGYEFPFVAGLHAAPRNRDWAGNRSAGLSHDSHSH
jgi:Xaa-Pro aminopeptidase